MTARDWRAGELRLLMVAVFLAVSALTAVGFFADRLQKGLELNARQLIGGDVVVASDQPLPAEFAEQASADGLRVAHTATFPSMARAADAQGGGTQLVAIKAVDSGYPLRGALQLREAPATLASPVDHGPAAGTAWVDPEVLGALGLKVGDPILLGDKPFRIARVIALEPDRGAGFLSLSPRVMISMPDLEATGLVQPASRVNYRFAVAGGDMSAVQRFQTWAQERIAGHVGHETPVRGARLETLDSGQPALQQTLTRAQKFLSLVALLAALLSAVAVAIAARDFARRHLDDCALLRVLGVSQRDIATGYVVEFGVAGVSASVLGTAAGYALHYVFVALLAGLVDYALPAAGVLPALVGLGVGLSLLVAFGLPPVMQLARVSPLRVLRRDVGALRPAALAVLAAGAAGFAALLLAVSGDWMLGLITVGGFMAAIGLFAALSFLALRLMRPVVERQAAPSWLRLAVRSVTASPASVVVQVSALAIGLLALILLVLLRTDLITSWRQATPADAPDRFVINVQPDQAQSFRHALETNGVARYDWYPMIRGRLVAINGKPVDLEAYKDDRARRLLDREFNLSYASQPPEYNRVSAGRWVSDEADGASVEAGLMETLGLKLGDRLSFDIAGIPIDRRITSARDLDWSSMHVNFFVMFPQAHMEDLPETFIAAFRAPPDPAFDGRLAQAFPNITSVNVSAMLGQIQSMLDQVIRAVEFLFLFSLAAGLVVLTAAISASRQERAREVAVLRALGASNRLLALMQGAELVSIGALAGLLASLAALAVGAALARFVFDFTWAPPMWVPLAGVVFGGVLVLAVGWLGLRGILSRPVIESLRAA